MNVQTKPYSHKVVNLIINEVNNFESKEIDLSDKKKFNQYQTIQTILTHQNKGFLTPLAPGQEDDREFYDIITPMIETGVVNIDLDVNHIDTYTDNSEHRAHELFSKAVVSRFANQTNQGTVLNDNAYQFIDDGNLIVRKVEGAEIYRPVLPQNLIIVDPSARTLEDTAVIERCPMSQTEVRAIKGWDNAEDLFNYCNLSDSDLTPYYEIFYYYGELSKKLLGYVKKETHNVQYKYQKGDNNNYIPCVVVVARAKKGVRNEKNEEVPGFVMFAEESKPQTIKVTRKLEIKRYKPYESARLGKFNGRFWGEGYREVGIPYQNRANELGNQIREIMKLASKMVFWSSDENIAGKNVISAIRNGQILLAKDLNLLNNVFPNLSLFAEEWNRNISEAKNALKAFEAASGEAMPSSTSATAIVVQNNAIGKYFDYKRERFGLLLSVIYKRWVLPTLLKDIEEDEISELTGDKDFLDEIITAYVKGYILLNDIKYQALNNGMVYQEGLDFLIEKYKDEMMKNRKFYSKITKNFFKDIEVFVGINVTGEGFNKQARVSNILKMLEFESDPENFQEDLNEVRQMLGLRVRKNKPSTQIPANPATQNLPIKEQPAINPTDENSGVGMGVL